VVAFFERVFPRKESRVLEAGHVAVFRKSVLPEVFIRFP
jgi:hypothetical protein